MRTKVDALRKGLAELPQYEPQTEHFFHAGMYCRKVYRDAGVLVVGAVHKKEHFYVIASGKVAITDGAGEPQIITAPAVIESKPGTQRAVLSLEPTTCLTFHVCAAMTVAEAEAELVEADPLSMYAVGNTAKGALA
jgi:mannose-6-phosphate isomerase-like protein (cupin superfamily)